MEQDLQEKRVELACAVVVNVIRYGHVEFTGGEWVITAPMPAPPGAGVILNLGRGPEVPTEVRAQTFTDTLTLAVRAGMATAAGLEERYQSLLRNWHMDRF